MNIYCFTICYNEEVILPHFLKHYSEFCDKIFVYDDKSTDKSREIIKSFPKAVLLDYPYDDEINDEAFAKLKSNCWKEYKDECDYVIVCDDDELLYSEDIKKLIEDNKECTVFKPFGYEMVGKETPTPDTDITKVIVDGVRAEHMDKCVLFSTKLDEINFSPGCHESNPVGDIMFYHNDSLKLLHYKCLSCEYNIKKNNTKSQRISQKNIDRDWGLYVFGDDQYATNIYKDILNRSTKII